jgi:hypothetical protein
MKKYFTYSDRLLIVFTGIISICAFLYFYFHGQENLSYYDALGRLNAARKLIESLNPGIGQLGSLWLPFPQILIIPFIWNDFFWHSGIAGYIVSGISFVIAGVYLQKMVFIMTQSRKIALLIWFIFVSNVNILLLQTMAMSEVFFCCFFILTIYNLVLWIKNQTFFNLLLTALCLMVLTLTRYEGYFVLVGVWLSVIVECVKTNSIRRKDKIAAMLLVFFSISVFGIILWCIYGALFNYDPLFWLHAYISAPPVLLNSKPPVDNLGYGIQNPTLIQSFYIYSSVAMWTIGVFTFLLGVGGMILFWFRPVRLFYSSWIISIVLLLCLGFGYFKGFIPHIEFPAVFLTGNNIRELSVYADNNVRYGIIFLPAILIFVGYLAKQSKFFFKMTLLFVLVQCFFSIVSPKLFQYPFNVSWRYKPSVEVQWFKSHYSGGLILIASNKHEDFMFETGLTYNKFIYEGAHRYWDKAILRPSRLATWVIFDSNAPGDNVYSDLTQSSTYDLSKKFTLVYVYKGFHFYKLRNSKRG